MVKTAIGTGDDPSATAWRYRAMGKIVVAGYYYTGSSSTGFALARYTANGALGYELWQAVGKVTTSIGSRNDQGYSVALQRVMEDRGGGGLPTTAATTTFSGPSATLDWRRPDDGTNPARVRAMNFVVAPAATGAEISSYGNVCRCLTFSRQIYQHRTAGCAAKSLLPFQAGSD